MKRFWNILGWVVGVAVSFYFYFESIKEREPTFIIDPLRPVLIDKDLLANKPLNIFDTSGQAINDNVSVITFYFFNQGRESIKRENILEPIRIDLPDKGRILDYKIP